MKLTEFIIYLAEYKRDITKQKLGDKLIAAAQNDGNQDIETILNTLEEIDPTKNKQYVEWLSRQYINKQFRLEDANRVKDVLVNFENIKRQLQQRDINKYTFHSLEDMIDKEMNVELKTDSDNFNIPNVKVLYNGPLGTLAIPETEEASCELGKGTKWCTAAKKDNMFNHYSSNGPLYIWKDKNGEKYQFQFPSVQFMDSRDRPVDHELLTYFRTKHPVLSKLFKEGEKEIPRDPETLYRYASDKIKDRWPEAESIIIEDLWFSYVYARNVIKGRWPEAEPYIMVDPEIAYDYAVNVIKGRWPEAEPYIMDSPTAAAQYARYVIKNRWPEAEPSIMTSVPVWEQYKKHFNI
jgi:hypothetical protein